MDIDTESLLRQRLLEWEVLLGMQRSNAKLERAYWEEQLKLVTLQTHPPITLKGSAQTKQTKEEDTKL